MINILIIIVLLLFAIGLYCNNKSKLKTEYKNIIGAGVENFNNYGIKNMETFLDYSTVDKNKYPEIKKGLCPKKEGNLHISFYQRDPPEENGWVFSYPHYRNYLGGSSAIN
tara:strand:+ start:1820 stop:2152 length:333 start_codon:yes stop_codon:yes gene_type:complete